jgi:hypothetical protein
MDLDGFACGPLSAACYARRCICINYYVSDFASKIASTINIDDTYLGDPAE